MVNIDRAEPKVTVGTEMGQTQKSTGTGNLSLTHIPSDITIKGHLMTGFIHTLIGVGPLCDADCTVTFTWEAVIVHDKKVTDVLTGWREAICPRLWRISLQPGESNMSSIPNDSKQATLDAYSDYDLPRVADLIRYFHSAAGYPVRSTWL